MINTKAIKTRISSVKNTKKITKAMEMIAAVKMRKAVQSAVNTRDYSTLAKELLEGLSTSEINHPLARTVSIQSYGSAFAAIPEDKKPTETGKHLLIIMTSNRGLCGSYNAKVLKKAYETLELHENPSEHFHVIAIGNKSGLFAKRNNLRLVALYDKLSDNPSYDEMLPVSTSVRSMFTQGIYDKVTLFYTNYISGLKQEPTERTLLPITKEIIESQFQDIGDKRTMQDHDKDQFEGMTPTEYDYEPKKKQVLNYLLPMLIDILLYQAVLESAASEHSSRMIAMKNASESAGEMIDSLTLEFNKGRQAAITQEISEIVGGAAALE